MLIILYNNKLNINIYTFYKLIIILLRFIIGNYTFLILRLILIIIKNTSHNINNKY